MRQKQARQAAFSVGLRNSTDEESTKGANNLRQHLISNHLNSGYSDFVFSSLKKIAGQVTTEHSKIIDVGCGQCRHLKLLKFLGFDKTNLYAIDRIEPKDHKDFKFFECDIELGIDFPSNYFDLVLANFLLMYINPAKLNFVISELLKITAKYLIIETNVTSKGTSYMHPYDFKSIVRSIQQQTEFEIFQLQKQSQKILVKRK